MLRMGGGCGRRNKGAEGCALFGRLGCARIGAVQGSLQNSFCRPEPRKAGYAVGFRPDDGEEDASAARLQVQGRWGSGRSRAPPAGYMMRGRGAARRR